MEDSLGNVHDYLKRLFASVASQCIPEEKTIFLCTQIDNYISGINNELARFKENQMGIMEIAGIVISLVTTFGPKAIDIWNDFHAEVGDNPTETQWNELKEKIKSHNPDSY